MEILTDFVMPVTAVSGKGGLKTSKYLNAEQFNAIMGLPIQAAVILPFIEGTDAKVQRHNVAHRIAMGMGRVSPQDRTNLPEYVVAVVENGIAVQRVTEQENTDEWINQRIQAALDAAVAAGWVPRVTPPVAPAAPVADAKPKGGKK